MIKMYVEFDDEDFRDVLRAIAMREQAIFPEGESNLDGRALAEICRGWREFMDKEGTPRL